MIQYIEEHYGDKMLLEDIASAAGKMLETGDSIGIIAEECGFTSDSYFGKMFKSIMGCSPREYRKKSVI